MKYLCLTPLLTLVFATAVSAETLQVHVPDMSCGSCASAIEARVTQEKGVTSVKTDVDAKVVTIQTDEATKLTDERVKELVKDAGFTAETIKHGA